MVDKLTSAKAPELPNHWRLMRDLVSFQAKLAMDGIRDLLLSPVSIAAVLFGIVFNREDPSKYYRQLLSYGHRSDLWINLFNTNQNSQGASSSNEYLSKIEDLLVDEYHKGGVVKSLKENTDEVLKKIQRNSKK